MTREKGGAEMRNGISVLLAIAFFFCPWMMQAHAQESTPAQKRIMIERGEKVTGNRLDLVKKVIESYKDCEVLSQGNELTGLRINGKLYSDFTLVVRDVKRTIIVATPDGVISFDY
jgi:predicted membrane protein